jgi:uncharacterized phiE125 gp8 family phage protein
MSVERESAVINNQIILRNNFRFAQTGDYFDPYAISKVEVLDSDGATVIETITGASIINDSTGKYHIVASAITSAKTIYDKWYFTPSAGATEITKTNTCIVWETAAGAGGLTTLNNLKLFLGINTANTDDDTLLTNLISMVSADIENECQRTFLATNHTEYYKGDGTSQLLVKQYPVNSVTSIYDDTDRVWGSDTQIDATEISISDRIGGLIILEDDIFSESDDVENIKITYNAGYSTIPSDLEQACIKLCAADYLESKGLMKGVDEGERNPDKLRKQADKIIQGYKRIR